MVETLAHGTKVMQKTWKMIETLAYGTNLRVLS